MSFTSKLIVFAVAMVVFPFISYLIVRLWTSAYFRSKHEFDNDNKPPKGQ